MAKDVPQNSKSSTLDGVDHVSVRSLTTALMDEGQNLDGANVAKMRIGLGFLFPWDNSLSRIGPNDLADVLDRADAADDRFDLVAPLTDDGVQRICGFLYSRSKDYMSLMGFETKLTPENREKVSSIASLNNGYGAQPFGGANIGYGYPEWWDSANTINRGWGLVPFGDAYGTTLMLQSEGVMDPSGSNRIADRIQINPMPYATHKDTISTRFEFYISRGQTPELLEFRIVPVRVLGKGAPGPRGVYGEVEYVVVKSTSTIRCVRR